MKNNQAYHPFTGSEVRKPKAILKDINDNGDVLRQNLAKMFEDCRMDNMDFTDMEKIKRVDGAFFVLSLFSELIFSIQSNHQ